MYLDKEKKAEVLIKLADVLWLTGNWEEAAGYISEAETLVEPSGVLGVISTVFWVLPPSIAGITQKLRPNLILV
jgi:hypothetical protein